MPRMKMLTIARSAGQALGRPAGRPVGAALAVLSAGAALGQTPASWLAATNGNWTDSTRWSTDPFFPNNGNNGVDYNVTIGVTGAAYDVNLDSDITVENVTQSSADASLVLGDFRLTINQNYALTNSRLYGRRELGGTGSVVVNGALTLTDVMIQRTTSLRTNGTISFNAVVADEICDTDVDHRGSAATWGGGGQILLGRGATFRNGASSVFTIGGNAVLGYNGLGALGNVVNEGTVRKNGGGGLTYFNDANFTNNGRVEVSSGTLKADSVTNFAGSTLTGGVWQVSAGAALSLVDQSDVNLNILTNAADVTLDGAGSSFAAFDGVQTNAATGKLTVRGGRNFTTAGAFTNAGELTVGSATTFAVASGSGLTNYNAGTRTLGGGGSFRVAGTLRFDGADIRAVASDLTLDGAAAAIQNSAAGNADALARFNTVASGGHVTITGAQTYVTGALDAFRVATGGRLTVEAGSIFEVNAAQDLANVVGGTITGGTLEARGIIRARNLRISRISTSARMLLEGDADNFRDLLGNNALSFLRNIDATGRLDVRGVTYNLTLGAGEFLTNGGTLAITNTALRAPARVVVDGNYEQTGNLLLEGGELTVTGTFNNLGTIEGNGTINGTLFSNGSLRPGDPGNGIGQLDINGQLSLGNLALIVIDLRAPADDDDDPLPGIDHDRVDIQGMLTFSAGMAGKVLFRAQGDAADYEIGTVYEGVVQSLAASGVFAEYGGLVIGDGKFLVPVWNGQRLDVVVSSVPAPGVLGVLGLAGLATYRRRRA